MNLKAVVLLACGVALCAIPSLGCSDAASAGGAAPLPSVAPGGGTSTPYEMADSGTQGDAALTRPAASEILGSPLCNASRWMGCYPDNVHAANSGDCASAVQGNGGNDNAPLACRVQPSDAGAGVGPVCGPAGSSTEGMSCGQPTDCAPGYECVADGRCRAYCCAGECESQNTFCDIQATVANPTIKVPVCMPVTPCGLLESDGCPTDQTCAVVRDATGTTSCVTVGPRQAGEECNTDHCERGLVCLGTSGERSCYILCHTTPRATECAGTSKPTCKVGIPLFPVPGIGICQ